MRRARKISLDGSDISKPIRRRFNYKSIPDEMKKAKRWVLWKLEKSHSPLQHAKKMPFNAVELVKHDRAVKADVSDPTTWADFKTAKRAMRRSNADGLGFVLGDGWCGLDIDDRERELAEFVVSPDVKDNMFYKIDQLVKKTYSEVSQSGMGTHSFFKADKPEGTRCKRGCYELYSKNRFFATTGNLIKPLRQQTIQTLSDAEMAELMKFTVGTEKVVTGQQKSLSKTAEPQKEKDIGNDLTVDELLEKVRSRGRFRSDILNGDFSGYPKANGEPDHSEMDFALVYSLAFWSNRDPRKVEQAFIKTCLIRPKWYSRRGATTYGRYTISKAISMLNKQGQRGYRYRKKNKNKLTGEKLDDKDKK